MANLKAKTEPATANAKGFVADGVVTYDIAKEYKELGCQFCLRVIDVQDTKYKKVAVNNREIYSIMNHQDGGSGLSFMPLIRVKSKDEHADLSDFLRRLEELGLPLNMTVWLDEESLKQIFDKDDPDKLKTYREKWAELIISAGYSVGYYYGGLSDESCSCDTSDTSNSVLSMVECGSSASGNTFRTISIGENTGTCKIRWAYLGASS